MSYITGLLLIDAPASALNNGQGEETKAADDGGETAWLFVSPHRQRRQHCGCCTAWLPARGFSPPAVQPAQLATQPLSWLSKLTTNPAVKSSQTCVMLHTSLLAGMGSV